MGQTARQDSQTRQNRQTKRLDAASFKPLALPALAAAVHMSRRDGRPAVAERDLPAILREDALGG